MKIINLHQNNIPKSDTLYILDSNVWLPVLGLDEDQLSEHYKIFFSKIFKTENCSIILCAVQLSEILNRLLRYYSSIAYDKKYSKYNGTKPSRSEFYKGEYRGSADFNAKYQEITDDLEQYSERIILKDIPADALNSLLTFKSGALDFVDNYLYLLAKENDAIIITHDADFFDLDITVGTFNRKLYKKYTSSIRPLK